MIFDFSGPIFIWRGPSPFYFVAIPEDESQQVKAISGMVTYGWGVIPVQVRIGRTTWQTSLIPKDGLYLVPIKAKVRAAEKLDEGDHITVHLEIGR